MTENLRPYNFQDKIEYTKDNKMPRLLARLPLQLVASVGSVKQALTTPRSVVSVVQVESSHLPANTTGSVADAP